MSSVGYVRMDGVYEQYSVWRMVYEQCSVRMVGV